MSDMYAVHRAWSGEPNSTVPVWWVYPAEWNDDPECPEDSGWVADWRKPPVAGPFDTEAAAEAALNRVETQTRIVRQKKLPL